MHAPSPPTVLLAGDDGVAIRVREELELLGAVYFTATTIATVGYGDINLLEAPDRLKIFDIGLMATMRCCSPRCRPSSPTRS